LEVAEDPQVAVVLAAEDWVIKIITRLLLVVLIRLLSVRAAQMAVLEELLISAQLV